MRQQVMPENLAGAAIMALDDAEFDEPALIGFIPTLSPS